VFDAVPTTIHVSDRGDCKGTPKCSDAVERRRARHLGRTWSTGRRIRRPLCTGSSTLDPDFRCGWGRTLDRTVSSPFTSSRSMTCGSTLATSPEPTPSSTFPTETRNQRSVDFAWPLLSACTTVTMTPVPARSSPYCNSAKIRTQCRRSGSRGTRQPRRGRHGAASTPGVGACRESFEEQL